MSQENVEIVRQVYEAFNRGDWDAVYRDFHPNVEMTTLQGDSTPGSSGGVRKVSVLGGLPWTI